MEPEDLARQLGITGKRLRDWLRQRYPRGVVDHGARWNLTTQQVAEASAHFRGTASPSRASVPQLQPRTSSAVAAQAPSRDAASRRAAAALTYRPERVRLLLVAEAPPSSLDRYFYFEDVTEQDALFRHVVHGLFGVVPLRHEKREWLDRLRDAGVFLIDVSEDPSGASALASHVGDCVQRCRALAPKQIALIKATVYDAMFGALRQAGLPVVDRRIPFPGSGQQTRFKEAFADALDLAGFERLL